MRAIEFTGPRQIRLRDDVPRPCSAAGGSLGAVSLRGVVRNESWALICTMAVGPTRRFCVRPVGWAMRTLGSSSGLARPSGRKARLSWPIPRITTALPSISAPSRPAWPGCPTTARSGGHGCRPTAGHGLAGDGPHGSGHQPTLRRGGPRADGLDLHASAAADGGQPGHRHRPRAVAPALGHAMGATAVIDASQENVVEVVRATDRREDDRLVRRGSGASGGPGHGRPPPAAARPADVFGVPHHENHPFPGSIRWVMKRKSSPRWGPSAWSISRRP